MRFISYRNLLTVVLVSIGVVCANPTVVAQEEGTRNGEWPVYGGDLAHTRYSPLDQINGDNFNDLEVAWTFRTDNFGPTPEFTLQSTPLMVNGIVYATVGTRRAAVALDAITGEILDVLDDTVLFNVGTMATVADLQANGAFRYTKAQQSSILK